nr:ankyrin repeat domain-containing protein 12-like [Penaeus vannamei]
MHLAACEGHRGAVEALAAGGADVDPVDHEGDTPLHGAASRGHLLAVGALVGLGASTSRKNRDGKTPQDLLRSPAESVFPKANECAEKKRMRKMQERIEQQEKDLREMKIKFDSKEAEAANLRKVIGDIKDEVKRKELEIRQVEIHAGLEFTHANIPELEAREADARRASDALRTRTEALAKETRDLRRALARSEERADYQDDQGRRNNLRFSGIPEEQNETWQQCQQKLGHLLQQHLNLAPVIERARRVGKPSHDKPRDIVAKFASFGDRDAVFKKKANFKNAPVFVFVHEDFCAGTIKARKDQMEQLKQARSEGKHAYFNYRKLVVTERSHPRSQPDSALPLQSRSSRASLSDPPSPMLRRPSTPAHNAPGPFASAPKTPEGASGNDTSPRQEDSLFSPLSQRLRSKQ